MKEIVLYEDEDYIEIARIGDTAVNQYRYYKDGKGNRLLCDSFRAHKEDIKKIYHAIEEEE